MPELVAGSGITLTEDVGAGTLTVTSGGSYATRSALAARVAPALHDAADLTETGREGRFLFSTANHSAHVTADPNQGLYIAPSSDTSGATGAWVRQWSALTISTWWGVAVGGTATANTAAYRAALATLAAIGPTGYGYITSGIIGLYTPSGLYLFNDELKPEAAIDCFGDSSDMGGGTVFQWSGSSGYMVHLEGYDGVDRHAMGASFRKTHIRGWYATAADRDTSKPAIYLNAEATLEDLFGEYCPTHFIEGFGDAGSTDGNLNGAKIRNVFAQFCDTTLYLHGPDSNGCEYENVSSGNNRLGGVWDHSFLGSNGSGGRQENNGLDTSFRSRCHVSGHIYVVKYGQETWCSTNAPTGAATSNTGWLYLEEGSTNFYTATWVTGQTWYWTAPVSIGPPDNGNTVGRLDGVYIEGGQNPIILAANAFCTPTTTALLWLEDGTLAGGNTRGDGNYLKINNGLFAPGNILAWGVEHDFGRVSGAALDTAFNINTTNSATITVNRYNSGGSLIATDGSFLNASGTWYLNGVFGIHLRYNGTDVANAISTGLDLPTGKILSVNGTQVVGARGSAVARLTRTATSGSLPTPDGSITIANAATPTVVELLEYCTEIEAKLEALTATLRAATGHGLIA